MSRSEELARRAVASKHWRWMPGMAFRGPDGAVGCVIDPGFPDSPHGHVVYGIDTDLCGAPLSFPGNDSEWLPDLDDPTTLGCLLALVREAWGDRGAHARLMFGTVRWYCLGANRGWYGRTEAAALVVALEDAP